MPTRAPAARPDPAASAGGPVLAIETSCDDTAVAVLAPCGAILAERVERQADHARFGGVVPEIAARAHLALLPGLVRDALEEAGTRPAALGLVAATIGPGLIGGLLVGSGVGKGIALAAGRPFVPINHLEAHALTARLPMPGAVAPAFPFLLLLLSGGHCQCVAVDAVGRYRRLGGTIDDAAGEAFDKVAKMLGLGWPGGPALEALAREGRPGAVVLPRPMLGRRNCDFSFSGLKTAVRVLLDREGGGGLARARAADIARGFEDAVADVLADRAAHALGAVADGGNEAATTLVVAGGVAANGSVRSRLEAVAAAQGVAFAAPPLRLCTDNAVMVGWAAIERARAGLLPADGFGAPARPRFPLEDLPASGGSAPGGGVSSGGAVGAGAAGVEAAGVEAAGGGTADGATKGGVAGG